MKRPEIRNGRKGGPRTVGGQAEVKIPSFGRKLRLGKSAIVQTANSWHAKIATRAKRRNSKRLAARFPAERTLFDRRWYVKKYPDVAAAKADAFVHFISGKRAGTHDPNALFDSSWYLAENPAVKESGIRPLSHYLAEGALTGRDPHPLFCTRWYLDENPEVSERQLNPLEHYLTIGRGEGRPPHPSFQSIEIPPGATLPAGVRTAALTSPVLCRVPPGQYLLSFQKSLTQSGLSSALDSYFCRAIVEPTIISSSLNENDVRIISSMDELKRRLASQFQNAPQSELVSIIIATRNRAEILPQSIASVVLQSYRNWQLIVVDDAGEDGTKAAVSEFDDDRIKYVRLPLHQGPAGARNAGLAVASGSIIAFLDDDDQWDPDFLLLSVNKMREDGKRMLYSAQMIWRDFDPVLQLGYDFKGVRYAPFNRSLLEHANYISMIAVVFDRELLLECGTFNESLNRYVDWELFLRFVEKETPASLPCVLSHYFQGRDRFNVSRVNDRDANLAKLRNITAARAGGVFEYHYPLDDMKKAGFFTPEVTRKERAEKLSGLPRRDVVIIIPSFESIDALTACIESVAKYTSHSHRIIVADNGSSQATRDDLDRLTASYDQMRWIPAKQGEGFSFAVNAGLAEVIGSGMDTVILNNDTIVTPNWLDELLYVVVKHPEAGMAVPRQVLAAGSPTGKIHVPGTMPTFELDISLSAHHNNVVDPFFDAEEGFVELNYAPLFCALIQAETLNKLGFLDAGNGPHYRSDWVYCNALRLWCGRKIVYTPYSKVYHLHGVATRQRLMSRN